MIYAHPPPASSDLIANPAADPPEPHRSDPQELDLLREVVETLGAMERGPTSPGERAAAEWLEPRLRDLGCEVAIDEEVAYPAYARTLGGLSAVSALAGVAGLTGRRHAAGAVGVAVAAAIADDISGGPRVVRRALVKRRPTWNVVAQTGDPGAERTLVVLAHHDAAPTGWVFDPSLQRWAADRFPDVIEGIDTSFPIWWPVVAAPALVAAGAALGSRATMRLGLMGSLISVAGFADIARDRIVPGANDNLSGVAALVGVASALREDPVERLRVMLVSCGSEEVLQGGIGGFARRHFPGLPTDRTWFLNLDTVGSTRLVMLEGEGPLVMEDYPDQGFRDLVARVAEQRGVSVRRGMRARSSTDSVVPSRAGYPTATIASVDRHKLLANYHLMSDVPENVEYGTVAGAVTLAEGVARELARTG